MSPYCHKLIGNWLMGSCTWLLARLGEDEPASIFVSAARLGAVGQPESFYFGSEKTEEEKAQTPL